MKRLLVLSLAFIGLSFIYLFPSAAAADKLPVYKLYVSFDIDQNLLRGISTITVPDKREINVSTNNLKIISVRLNGSAAAPEIKGGMFKVTGEGTLEITYEGVFGGENVKANPENVGVVSGNLISEKGIYLTGGWYPSMEGMAFYSLKALLPKGFIALSEADEITVNRTPRGAEYSFSFPHPLNEIDMVAGKYVEKKETFNGIDLYAYFFTEDIRLAKKYIEYSKKYLEMYEKLLSPYPYKRFSVVENFLETGYSMPTFTLLGKEVVRLPFIVKTSLGHEILHQWFGNLVHVDYEKGNWSEGLTSYLSDQFYEELEGRGWQYRKQMLIDYESYVNPEKEFPLKDFTSRFDLASKAIGYGKGSMLFHMLRKMIGDDAFYDALKMFIKENEFKQASWDDIKMSFEKTSGKDLGWFFSQWLNRKGVVSIEIKEQRAGTSKGVPAVYFAIIQKGEPFKFNLPLEISTARGEITEILNIEKAEETFEISAKGAPSKAIFDGGYDLMRRLSKEEYPPVISRLLGDEKKLIVIPEGDEEKYRDLFDVFKEVGFSAKEEKDVGNEDVMTSSLLLLGYNAPIIKRLFADLKKPGPGFIFTVKQNPLNASKVIAIAYGDSKEEIERASKKILHYGKYSFIRFEKGENIEKKTDETEKGIEVSLYEPVPGIEPQKTTELDEIINNIYDEPVIYVAELHTAYEDHRVQLKVITDLHEKGRKFAIGMEMFQRPFQKAINDYISGTMNEKEFLKATEYFKRWQFDYNLYREIIEFAKAKSIPVVALNLRSEIVDKVSTDGLDALTDEERKEIPEDMDMTDEEYKKRLRKIFGEHEEFGSRNFEYFYQSQILWDETMAHSIDEFMKEMPDHQMVVLAGVGHIMYDSGIPQRAYRLNAKSYVTLIPDTGTISKDIANFVLFPKHIPAPAAPKLGVVLGKVEGGVKIEEVRPDSAAGKAGLKKGDILLSSDGWKIESIEDVKISIFDKTKGETVKIKILRKRFLAGFKEIEIDVIL